MKKILATTICLMIVAICSGANYYRELLLLPMVAAGGGNTYYTDPYAANLVGRWDFDATAWTNDATANAYNLRIDGSGVTVSNVIVGTNVYGRAEKAAYFSAGQRLRRIIPQAEFTAWSNTDTVVSYWINRGRTNAGEYCFGLGGTNAVDDGVLHDFTANDFTFQELIRSNATSLTSDGYPGRPVTNALWYHVVEYRSSKTTGSKVWFNGVMVANDGSSAFRTYTYDQVIARLLRAGQNGGLSFGDRPGSQSAYRGFIDNTRIYNSAAATNNIAWLYQYTHPTNNLETR